MSRHVSYRTLLIDLTRRDFLTRYLGSLLGSYWNVVHPLVMILIYTLVFSKVMKARLGGEGVPFSYSLYLCSGLIPWTLFTEIVNRGTVTLVENAAFLKKLALPPYFLFIVSVLSSWVNFLISFLFFYVFLLLVHPLSPLLTIEYLGVVLLLSGFAFGLALGIGCLNVFLRDFQQMTTILFQLWFWFTPIVYAVDVLPKWAADLLWFNPAFAFLHSLHELMFYRRQPDPALFGLMIFWTALALGFGFFVYRKTYKTLRDYL